MPKTTLIILLLISTHCLSLNPNVTKHFSVDPETEVSQTDSIDPSQQLFLVQDLLKDANIVQFKKDVKALMRDFGWNFNADHILRGGPFIDALRKHDLIDWLTKASGENYPIWVEKNPVGFYYQQKINALVELDQNRSYFYALIDNAEDSLMIKKVRKQLELLDQANLLEIIELCKIDGFPNGFDHGIHSYTKTTLVLLHSLQWKYNFDNYWLMIFPYIETAYLQNKIPSTLFSFYDKLLVRFYGEQYYGTIKDAPVRDEDGLADRREKYGL